MMQVNFFFNWIDGEIVGVRWYRETLKRLY